MSMKNRQVIQLDEHQAGVVLMDSRWLSTSTIDLLSDQYHDWIGLLQADQKIELYDLSLLGVEASLPQKYCEIAISDIVALTLQAPYQKVSVSQQLYWSYTCCLQGFGLGRIRFVVCFDNSERVGPFQAFITNRLDWSATRVLMYWLNYRLPTSRRQVKVSQYTPYVSVAAQA